MPAGFTATGLFGFLIIMGLVGLFWYFLGPIIFKDEMKDPSKPGTAASKSVSSAPAIPVRRDFDTPCQIVLARLSKFRAAWSAFSVYLNGIEVGKIKNGSTLSFSTFLSTNELKVLFPPGNYTSSTTFHAASGESVSIIVEYPREGLQVKK